MGSFGDYSYEQTVFLPLNFNKQILPGTFEYTLHNLIDKKIDLSVFYEWVHNDETGQIKSINGWMKTMKKLGPRGN